MQLQEIISKLSATELSEVESRVAEANKPALSTLLKELKKICAGKREYDKMVLFKNVFGEPFNHKKEYLLKNEIRKLTTLIYRYLAESEVQKELKDNNDFWNLWLMKALARHDMRGVFEPEIEKLLKSANESLNVDAALQLMQVKRAYYSTMGYTNPLGSHEYMQLLEDIQRFKIRSMVRLVSDIDGSRALVVKEMATKKGHILFKDEELNLDRISQINLEDYEDELTHAARLKGDMYLQSGHQRINTTSEFLTAVQNLVGKGLVSVKVEVQLLETLASYLLAEHQYQQAWTRLDEHEAIARKEGIAPSVALYHSRLYCLVLWGKYQDAILYYETNKETVTNNRYFFFAVHDVCYAHLFMGNTKEAITLVVKHLSDISDEKVFDVEYKVRFAFIIAHIIDNNLEDAERELANFKRAKLYKQDEVNFYRTIVSFYDQYLKQLFSPDATFSQLLHDVQKYNSNLKSPVLQLLWLEQQLSKRAPSKR